jgi:hypothetical protein
VFTTVPETSRDSNMATTDKDSDFEMEITSPRLAAMDEACSNKFTFGAAIFDQIDSPMDDGCLMCPAEHDSKHINGPRTRTPSPNKTRVQTELTESIESRERPHPLFVLDDVDSPPNLQVTSPELASDIMILPNWPATTFEAGDLEDTFVLDDIDSPPDLHITSPESASDIILPNWPATTSEAGDLEDAFGSLTCPVDDISDTSPPSSQKTEDLARKVDLRDYWKVETAKEKEERHHREWERLERDQKARVFQDEQSQMNRRDRVRAGNRERAQRWRDLKREKRIEGGWAPGQKRVSVAS